MANRYKLYQGDCLEVMKNIPSKSINLVLIDPPYNIGKDKWDRWKTTDDYVNFMGEVFKECERILKYNGSFYFFHNDFLQMVELQNFINKNTKFKFKQLLVWNKRFNEASNKGFLDGFVEVEHLRNYQQMAEYCLFYTFEDETGLTTIYADKTLFKPIREYLRNEAKKAGLTYKDINRILEYKSNGGGFASHYFTEKGKQWGFITENHYKKLQEKTRYFQKPYNELRKEYEELRKEYEELRKEYEHQRYTFNNLKKHHSIMNYEIVKKQGHITPKPVDLLEYIIKTSSNEDDIILDCFMGSGSTGVGALNTNRKFIGIELDENYFNIAKQRIEEAENNQISFKLGEAYE